MRHPSTFAAATLAAVGLAFAGCGSSSSKTEAGGYSSAVTSASQKAAATTPEFQQFSGHGDSGDDRTHEPRHGARGGPEAADGVPVRG